MRNATQEDVNKVHQGEAPELNVMYYNHILGKVHPKKVLRDGWLERRMDKFKGKGYRLHVYETITGEIVVIDAIDIDVAPKKEHKEKKRKKYVRPSKFTLSLGGEWVNKASEKHYSNDPRRTKFQFLKGDYISWRDLKAYANEDSPWSCPTLVVKKFVNFNGETRVEKWEKCCGGDNIVLIRPVELTTYNVEVYNISFTKEELQCIRDVFGEIPDMGPSQVSKVYDKIINIVPQRGVSEFFVNPDPTKEAIKKYRV